MPLVSSVELRKHPLEAQTSRTRSTWNCTGPAVHGKLHKPASSTLDGSPRDTGRMSGLVLMVRTCVPAGTCFQDLIRNPCIRPNTIISALPRQQRNGTQCPPAGDFARNRPKFGTMCRNWAMQSCPILSLAEHSCKIAQWPLNSGAETETCLALYNNWAI